MNVNILGKGLIPGLRMLAPIKNVDLDQQQLPVDGFGLIKGLDLNDIQFLIEPLCFFITHFLLVLLISEIYNSKQRF